MEHLHESNQCVSVVEDTQELRKQRKKRIRNRPRRPRLINNLGPKPASSMRWLKIGWKREEDFQEGPFLEIQRYLADRHCEVQLRPRSILDPTGPQSMIFVRVERTTRAYNAIKRKVARMQCGMSTWKAPSPPPLLSTGESGEDEEGDSLLLKKGA